MKRVLVGVFVLWTLSEAHEGFAQDDPCLKAPPAASAPDLLRELAVRRAILNCYDIGNHTPDTWQPVIGPLEAARQAQTGAERWQGITEALAKVEEVVAAEMHDATRRAFLAGKIDEARSRARNEGRDLTGNVLETTAWRVTESTPSGVAVLSSKVLPDTDFNAPIRKECRGAGAEAACAAAIGDYETTLRAHDAVEVALAVVHEEVRLLYQALFEARHNMWEAYRTQARPQYFWEWMANSPLIKDDRPRDENGNPLGPASLPKGQMILAHPGIGLERFEFKDGDQTQNNPTLFIEWIGYNRLRWDYGAGKLTGGVGVSVIGVFAPRDDSSNWSNGIMFWVQNKYGLAVTRNGDGTSLMGSVDLAELFRDKMNEIGQKRHPLPDGD
jgi:hypothetical protein